MHLRCRYGEAVTTKARGDRAPVKRPLAKVEAQSVGWRVSQEESDEKDTPTNRLRFC